MLDPLGIALVRIDPLRSPRAAGRGLRAGWVLIVTGALPLAADPV
jgi:hypothetical protein